VGQRLRSIGERQRDIAGLRLLHEEPEPQAGVVHGVHVLPPLQRVPRPLPDKASFLSALESCERLIVCPSRRSTSLASRASVQFARSAAGQDQKAAPRHQFRQSLATRDRCGLGLQEGVETCRMVLRAVGIVSQGAKGCATSGVGRELRTS
jgi:hypothetical protein